MTVVQCERADALAAGASYPTITITVNVPATALPSVTNTANVSGGDDVNAANNTAADVTTISPGPDLAVSKSHSATIHPGTKRSRRGSRLPTGGEQCRRRADHGCRDPD